MLTVQATLNSEYVDLFEITYTVPLNELCICY